MDIFSHNKIGRRLLRLVFGLYFVVALIGTATQLYFEYQNAKENTFNELANLGQIVDDNLVQGLWNYDLAQIDSALAGVEKNIAIKGTKISSVDNTLSSGAFEHLYQDSQLINKQRIGEFGKGYINEIAGATAELKNKLYEYEFPIYNTNVEQNIDELLGFGYLYTDHTYILEKVKYSLQLIVVSAIVKTISLWLIFLFFVEKVISRPLNKLAKAAKKMDRTINPTLIQDNNLKYVVPDNNTDELDELVNTFNSMRDSVNHSIKTIEFQNENLEKRVIERTEAFEKINAELEIISLQDALTKLPNRKLFESSFANTLQQAQRDNVKFSVAIIDLRKFKSINDKLGHHAGDSVLRELGNRMQSVIQTEEVIARMGGDEFALILHKSSEDELVTVARTLLDTCADPIVIEGKDVFASMNVGFSVYPDNGRTSELLLRRADSAMYHAKQENRGYEIYNSIVQEYAERISNIEKALSNSQFLDQLEVYYQPLIYNANRRVKGLEALVRWNHPELGPIPPTEFIPIAERSTAIRKLTSWVTQRALRETEQLREIYSNLSISINISGVLINDDSFSSELEILLNNSELNPDQIILEITESAAINDSEKTLRVLRQIKTFGVRLSIDDFGSGYSSLSYLTRLPVDELKMDRSLIIDTSQNSRIVMKSIIDMAHNLNLEVVAEGVENEEIIQELDTMGADYFQGYYYSPPLSFNDLQEWIEKYEYTRLSECYVLKKAS